MVYNDPAALVCYVSSDRSDGKTTDLMRHVYDEFKQSGRIGVKAARFINDVTPAMVENLITKLRAVRPKLGEISIKGSPKRDGLHVYEDGKQFLHCVPLSRVSAVKEQLDVKTHHNVYFDEYTPVNGRYLKGEVNALLELWRTVDRDTWSNKIICYSNHITASNPIFNYFDIYPRDGVTRWKNGRFILLQVANKGNREQVKLSPLGELTAGTSYGEYATGGTMNDLNAYICARHTRDCLPFYIRHGGKLYALYLSRPVDNYGFVLDYVLNPSNNAVIYTTTPNGGTAGGIYLPRAAGVYKRIKTLWGNSQILCASQRIYEDCAELFKMLK